MADPRAVAQVQCPHCGAMTASEGGTCQSCGGSLPPPAAPPMQTAQYAAPAPGYAAPPPGYPPPHGYPPQAPPGYTAPAPMPGYPQQPPPPGYPQAPQPPAPAMGAPPPGYGTPPVAAGAPGAYPPPQAPPGGYAPPPGAVMAPAPGAYGQVPTVLTQGQQMAKDALPMRIIAILVDGVILGVINQIIAVILFFGPLGFLSYFTIWGLFLGYFVILEGTRGQTIGKMLAGVKVVREDMSPIQFEQALFRALDLFLWGITFGILALIDLIFVLDNGQRFGDRWAKTIVIKTS